MQAHRYSIVNTADVALSAGVARTVLQLATGTQRKTWTELLDLNFESNTASDLPVLIQLCRQSSAGTGSSAVTPNPLDEGYPNALSTAIQAPTAEPTTGVVVWQTQLTPVGGTLILPFAEGKEPSMVVSSRFGLVVTAPQGQNCRAMWVFRE